MVWLVALSAWAANPDLEASIEMRTTDVAPLVQALGLDGRIHEREDIERAFEARCDAGVAWACGGPPSSFEEATERWGACAEGAPVACAVAGWNALRRGDYAAALSPMESACLQGVERACVDRAWVEMNLGLSGPEGGNALMLGLGCGEGDAYACKVLGFAHRFGVGVPRVLNESVRRFDRACALGEIASCSLAVDVRLMQGEDAVDASRDLPRVRQACEQGCLLGCRVALVLAPEDRPLAESVCALGEADACLLAGGLVPKGSHEERRQLLAAACRLGSTQGCVAFGTALIEGPRGEREPEQASQVLGLACEQGDPVACLVLGVEQLPGGRLKEDAVAGVSYLQRACTADLAAGCLEASRAHRIGATGTRDAEAAATFKERACALGVVRGCPRD